MDKTRQTNRLGMVALVCLTLSVGILFTGCGKEPQEEKKPATKVEAKTTVPSKAAAPTVKPKQKKDPQEAAALPTKSDAPKKPVPQEALIKCFKDIQFIRSGRDTAATPEKVALHEKMWETLLAQAAKTAPLCDEAELIASSFEAPEKQGDPTLLYLLLRVKRPFEKDRGLHIWGYVDKTHLQHLPEASRSKGYAAWSYFPDPPTSQWKSNSISIDGESYVLIRKGVVAEKIPYNIKIAFFTNEGSAKYGNYGKTADLGWRIAE